METRITDHRPVIDAAFAALRHCRFDLTSEKRTQEQIAEVLRAKGIHHSREAKLGPGDVADFLVCDAVVLEVKLNRGRPKAIFKQLERYASHESVEALALLTNKAMGLPPVICGKPAFYLSLGRAWL